MNYIHFKKGNGKVRRVNGGSPSRTILLIVPKIITIRDKNIFFRDKNIFFSAKYFF
jgi:hypothetical protein